MSENTSGKVLVIDDDSKLAQQIQQYLAQYQFAADTALLPSQALEKLAAGQYDLLIVDVMMPEMDGFELCKMIRKDNDVPIIMLTARGEPMDRIVGLEIGADDYLAKPFEPRELVARIRAILKRSGKSHDAPSSKPKTIERVAFGELVIDYQLQQVKIGDKSLKLTTMEYRLLELLSQNPAKPMSRDEIMNTLRGIDAELFSRAIDVSISRLRTKLKPIDYIQTVWGSGYAFIAPDAISLEA